MKLYHVTTEELGQRILARSGFDREHDGLVFGKREGVRLYTHPNMGNPLFKVDLETGDAAPIFKIAAIETVDGVPIADLPDEVTTAPDFNPKEWEREPFYGTMLYDNYGDTRLVVTFPDHVALAAYQIQVGVQLRNRRTGRILATSRFEPIGEWLVPLDICRLATVELFEPESRSWSDHEK